jgi:hypothetical protein
MDVAAAEREALAVIGPAFEAAEQKAASERQPGLYEPRVVGAAAAKSPLSLHTLVRAAGGDGWQLHSFEAVRTYARRQAGPARNCDEETVMTGWLLEGESGRLSILSSTTTLTDCDRKGSERIAPLAYTTIGGRAFVIVLARHYEGEDYRIYETDGTSIREVARAEGGGC